MGAIETCSTVLAGYCRNGTTNQTCPEVLGDARLGRDADESDDAFDAPSGNCTSPYDEDMDGLPDDCDPCPYLGANAGETADADADGDGVGNRCDPVANDPAAPQRFVAFEGFNGPNALPNGWSNSDPAADVWEVKDGQMMLSATDTLANLIWTVPGLDAGKGYQVTTRVHITDIDTMTSAPTFRGAGLIHYATGKPGRTCTFSNSTTNGTGLFPTEIKVDLSETNATNNGSFIPAVPVMDGVTYELTLVRQPANTWSCSTPEVANGVMGFVVLQTPPSTDVQRTIGVRARAATAKFDFIYVIELP